MFWAVSHFRPSLTFADKAGANLSGASYGIPSKEQPCLQILDLTVPNTLAFYENNIITAIKVY